MALWRLHGLARTSDRGMALHFDLHAGLLSLSLSLAGLLSPSTSEPIVEHARLLDRVFNDTYHDFVHQQPTCGVPTSSWPEWFRSSFSHDPAFSSPLGSDCDPVAQCMPAFQRVLPDLRPSSLALRVVAESRIVSRRIWVERQAASVLESFSRRAQQLQATAVQFASDHALGLLVFYGFFPAKAVGRCLCFLAKVCRASGH